MQRVNKLVRKVKFLINHIVKVGVICKFIGVSENTFGSEPYLIEIGNHVMNTSGFN